MTTVLDNQIAGPALHAFVIAVGLYQHLPGGPGPTMPKPLGMGQLTTPPISAMEFLRWLESDYRHPTVPLGSVELLVSSPDKTAYGESLVDAATLGNVQAAKEPWLERCDSHPDNVALFYFCGHGVQRDNHYLLLEDFGADRRDPLAHSIDLNRSHDGMAGCRAGTQVFIADACRKVPWEYSRNLGESGIALIPPVWGGNTDRDAPILRATAKGKAAAGPPGQATYFTTALLRALRGAGATQDIAGHDRWEVRYLPLASAVMQLLTHDGTPKGTYQVSRSGGEAGDPMLADLPGTPQVTVIVELDPPDSAGRASLSLVSASGQVVSTRAPEPGPWRVEVPAADGYRLKVHYTGDRYLPSEQKIGVFPPIRRIPLKARSR